MTKEKAIYMFLFLLCIAQTAYYYPLLPENMASRFGFSGQAYDWISRETFFALEYAVILMTFAAISFSSWIIRKHPDKVNMTNKDYWMAPARRDETVRFFNTQMERFGIALTLFMLFVMQCVIDANLKTGTDVTMDQTKFFIGFAAFMAFVLIWTITLVIKFARIPSVGKQSR